MTSFPGMHIQRSSPDRLPAKPELMREEDVRRMLAAQNDGTPHRRRLPRALLRLAVLFTVYVLSIGPLYWRWYGARVGLDSRLFLILYHPLDTLAKWFPPLGHFLNWYISLWIY